MAQKWTRDQLVRNLLQRESEGLPPTLGGARGVDQGIYRAARKMFGSWHNALLAAGVSPQSSQNRKWHAAKILSSIRRLSKRRHPIGKAELRRKHGFLVSASRRTFGSWTKAVMTSGADPAKFRCSLPWSRERVIEGILVRALKGELTGTRSSDVQYLINAGRRHFGSWEAALEAAGVNPAFEPLRGAADAGPGGGRILETHVTESPVLPAPALGSGPPRLPKKRHRWSKEAVVKELIKRARRRKKLNSSIVKRDHNALYIAANRYFGTWANALLAAGFCPEEVRKHGISPIKNHLVAGFNDPKKSPIAVRLDPAT